MEKHTILESLIERRNFFQGRLVTNMADEVYFSRRAQKAKAELASRGMTLSEWLRQQVAKFIKALNEKD